MGAYRSINVVLALLFALFAGLQFDGDPLRAGLAYGTASLVCALIAADHVPPPHLTLGYAALCTALALTTGLRGTADPRLDAVGLALVATWMVVVSAASSGRARRRPTGS